MKRDMLLPYGFKRIGWVLLVPTLLFGILMWIDGFNGFPSFLLPPETTDARALLDSPTADRICNNVVLIGILAGALFIACSRERIEDELIGRIRLNALLAAFYANIAITVVAALCVYDLDFLSVMIYNLFTMPLLFVAIEQTMFRRLRKEARDEE